MAMLGNRRLKEKTPARWFVQLSFYINYDALGKWIEGFDGRKVLNRRQTMNVSIAAQSFLRIHMIETYSDLALFFKDEKSRINEKRGVRSNREKKVLALRDCRRFRVVLS